MRELTHGVGCLFGDDSLMYHLSQLFFNLLLVLDGNFPSSVLDWKDCRVCLDVVLSWHVTYAVKAVGEQHLKIPGTVNGCRSRLHIEGVESQSFWWWTTWGLIFHWLCCLCCLRIWNYLTHLINRDHIPGVESFDSICKGLERSQLLGSILHGLERICHFLTLWANGLERSQICFIFATFGGWSWKETFTCVFVRGLERVSDCAIWAVVLKDSDEWFWKDSDLLLCFLCCGLPSIFSWWSWKESLKLVFFLFSMTEMDLETFLYNTRMRPNLTLAGCPMMISYWVLVSMT